MNGRVSGYSRGVIAHFERLNAYLEQKGSPTFYKFNFISPVNFNTFFQHIREGRVKGFRSDLDVRLKPENGVLAKDPN
jgi:hypothetical protein